MEHGQKQIQPSIENRWHPTDYGFYRDINRGDVFYNGNYELRSFPEDMWLLRRKIKKGTLTAYAVKFYYLIKQTDCEFAGWLLSKRLNKS
jgi:hypothetical protein